MITTETLSLSYGIASALAWGSGDFAGGIASKRGSVLAVVLFSQLLGSLVLAGAALIFSEPVPPMAHMGFGALAGIFGILGLIALYRGLARGRMGIVAPLSAVLTALVPIAYTALDVGFPTGLKITGFLFFMAGVWLLSSGNATFKISPLELGLSITAGFGFGLFFIFIDQANEQAIFWPLVAARAASISLLLVTTLFTGKSVKPTRGQWIFMGLTGLLDAAGNCFFSLAAQLGRLDVAAVLGSLYPASTVILAFVFLKERLQRRQWMGVAAAFTALVLISI